MPKYQGKPKQIEAVQHTGFSEDLQRQVQDMMIRSVNVVSGRFLNSSDTIAIETVDANIEVYKGDYIAITEGKMFLVFGKEYFESRYEMMWGPSRITNHRS